MAEGRRRRPRQARSRATVDAILEAAAQVLTEHGPQGATTNRIAERAGVSVGTVYQYFANKRALFTALGDRFLEGMGAAFSQAVGRHGSAPWGTLPRALLGDVLDRVATDPVLHGMLHVTAVPPRDFEGIEQLERAAAKQIALIFSTHPGARAAFPDPELAARVLVRGIAGVIARTLATEPDQVTNPQFREALFRFVEGYLPPSLDTRPDEC